MRDIWDWIGSLLGMAMLVALIALPFTVAKAVYVTDPDSVKNAIYNLFLVVYLAEMAKGFLGGNKATREK